MQSYINYLLQDLEAAQGKEVSRPGPDAKGEFWFEAHSAEGERFVQGGEPEHPFSYYCGLEAAQFPPAEKLNPEQLCQVISAFNLLLLSWNLGTDIPEELPPELTYQLLVSTLEIKTEIVNEGFITLEFCSYEPASCLFGKHCRCKDLEELNNPDLNASEGELPF